jgi:biopolymer transport protein TolR
MSTAFSRQVRKRKLKSDINVVPYIDVMLVLLVIFMITAPLLNLGVDIDLPQSDAKALEAKSDPVQVIIGRDGGYRIRVEGETSEVMDLPAMGNRLKALADANPKISVILSGDASVPYGVVSEALGYVAAAGIDNISLQSKQREPAGGKR